MLTEADRALIGPAREVAHGMALARAAVESVDGLTTGRVEIVASATRVSRPVDRRDRPLHPGPHPGVAVAIRAALSAEQVVESVRSGRTELGLLASAGPVPTDGLRLHPVARQRFVLVTPPDGPFRPGP
ncbi:MAG TPA: LysR substrate-binding domain-containing protein [Pseudonocardia sp.]|nr:LysR substrate-binding domain-containing protein [Pseudonocardia sp.]